MNVRELTARVEVLEALTVELTSIMVRSFVLSPRAAEELGIRLTGIASTGDIDADLAEWIAEDLARSVFVDEAADWGEASLQRIVDRAAARRRKFGPLDASMA